MIVTAGSGQVTAGWEALVRSKGQEALPMWGKCKSR